MKRLITLALGLTLIAFSTTTASAAMKRMNFGTGGTTGIYYTLGGVIAQKLTEKGVMEITVQSTGASNENLRLVEQNEVPLAFTQNDLAYAAFNGLAPYKSKYGNIMAIAATHSELIHAVAREGSGVNRIEDFKGRKISVGARGSGNEANCRQIFPFFGLDPSYKDINAIFLPYGESVDQFKDRMIDGFLFTFPFPHPIMMDITTTHKVVYLPIEGRQADDIIAKFPYFFKAEIPANTYKDQEKPVPTIGVKAMLITNKDASVDDVYAVTKGLFENLDDIRKGHSKAAEISLDTALEAVTIPLHPGAEKYYREMGLLK